MNAQSLRASARRRLSIKISRGRNSRCRRNSSGTSSHAEARSASGARRGRPCISQSAPPMSRSSRSNLRASEIHIATELSGGPLRTWVRGPSLPPCPGRTSRTHRFLRQTHNVSRSLAQLIPEALWAEHGWTARRHRRIRTPRFGCPSFRQPARGIRLRLATCLVRVPEVGREEDKCHTDDGRDQDEPLRLGGGGGRCALGASANHPDRKHLLKRRVDE